MTDLEKAADIEKQEDNHILDWRHADDDDKWRDAFIAGAKWEQKRTEKLVEALELFIHNQEEDIDCQCCLYNMANQESLREALREYRSEK